MPYWLMIFPVTALQIDYTPPGDGLGVNALSKCFYQCLQILLPIFLKGFFEIGYHSLREMIFDFHGQAQIWYWGDPL